MSLYVEHWRGLSASQWVTLKTWAFMTGFRHEGQGSVPEAGNQTRHDAQCEAVTGYRYARQARRAERAFKATWPGEAPQCQHLTFLRRAT